jgi:hypothetical protein
MHSAICGQVIKKKDAPCLGPNISAGNGPRWRLKDTPTAAIFCFKGTDQHVRVWSKMAFFRTRKAVTIFLLSMYQYGRSFLLSIFKIPSAQCVLVSKYTRTQAKFVERIYQYLWLKIYFRRKLESHVLYLCTGQDGQKYPSTKCTRMYIFLSHEENSRH